MYTKLDCTCLPLSIQREVDEYLSDRFAYTFAFENLCMSIDEGAIEKQIFLPENPYNHFFKDLKNLGIVTSPRISTYNKDVIEEEDFEEYETIQQIILDIKTKLHDRVEYHLSMIPFEKYLTDQKITVDSELKHIMDNGMKAVLTKAEKSVGFTLLSNVVGGITKCAKAVWSGVKSVGNFFYEMFSTAVNWVTTNIIDPVADIVKETAVKTNQLVKSAKEKVTEVAKEKVAEVATMIVESEAFQAVADCAKSVANGVGTALKVAVEVIHTVGDVTGINAGVRAIGKAAVATKNMIVSAGVAVSENASKAWTKIKSKASEAAEYIGSTKAFQLAKEAAKIVSFAAVSAYKKMATLCTAVVESYEYYNQCRSSSRKIAMEDNTGVDEHVILKNYMNARSQEQQTEGGDFLFQEVRYSLEFSYKVFF